MDIFKNVGRGNERALFYVWTEPCRPTADTNRLAECEVYAHFGQASYALEALNSGEFDVLSGATKGIDNPATAMYDRISRPGKATEHTLYAFPSGIGKDIERKGLDMTMPEDYPGKFRFADPGETAEYEGYPDAAVLKPGGNGGKNGFGGVRAVFEYNPADRKYYRSTYGSPHVDELTGEQVAVTNVIFQYCDGNVLDAKDYLHFAAQSEKNPCTVFTNGKMIEGYWSNPGELGTPARYYDENDQEITLNTGTTFICIICVCCIFHPYILNLMHAIHYYKLYSILGYPRRIVSY